MAQTLFGLSSIILGFFLLLAVSVRPIADDYCTGAGVTQGFWNYIYQISQTWSGDFSQIVVHALLVGLPLANLPINLLGFPTFLLSVYLLLAVFDRIWLYLLNAKEPKMSKINKFFAAALISWLWNIYWALPASLDFGFHYDAFAMSDKSFSAVLGWPTVIVQYLIIPLLAALSILLWAQKAPKGYILILVFGLFVGNAGYAFALTLFLTIFVLQLIRKWRMDLVRFWILEISICLGVFVSLLTPGTRSRNEALHPQDTGGDREELPRWLFVSSLELFASIFSFGNLFIFFYSFFLFVLLKPGIKDRLNEAKLNNLLIKCSLFLSISYFVVSLSELFVYEAFWHLTTYRTTLFFFWILLGLQMALRFFAKQEPRGSRCERVLRARSSMVIVLTTVVLVTTISWKSNSSLIERAAVWETRSAPLPGLGDIDPKGGWVDLCWQRLKVERDLPERVV
jgi:hypothetical protein